MTIDMSLFSPNYPVRIVRDAGTTTEHSWSARMGGDPARSVLFNTEAGYSTSTCPSGACLSNWSFQKLVEFVQNQLGFGRMIPGAIPIYMACDFCGNVQYFRLDQTADESGREWNETATAVESQIDES